MQKLPDRMSTLEDKFIRLEEIVEYEVKKGENLHYDTKRLITIFMKQMKVKIKFLMIFIMDKIDSSKKKFISAYALEDTFSEVNTDRF